MSQHSIDSMINHAIDSSSSESLYIMMEQECITFTYSSSDYLRGDCDDSSCTDDSSCSEASSCSNRAIIHDREFFKKEKVTPADRLKLVDWCYAIVDQCNIQRETVAHAMNFVDRFMSIPRISTPMTTSLEVDALYDRAEYQLVTITALYISIKLTERTIFGSQAFARASHGVYSVEEIEGMELKILHTLSWRMCPTSSLQVGNHILSLVLPEEVIAEREPGMLEFLQEEVAYQTENAVRDYYFVTQRPSTIAIAAIMNAIESVRNRDCRYLTKALMYILKETPVESSAVLLEVRHRLLILTGERGDYENTSIMVSKRARVPPQEEKPRIPSANEVAFYHRLVQLARDNLRHTVSSSNLVISDDSSDDDSGTTIHYD